MRLTIEGCTRELMPIRAFRAAYGLPETFGVALFEPKNYSGLGSIERAGAALNGVRAAVLEALPASHEPAEWLAALPELSVRFQAELQAINPIVGLKPEEIGFAAAGFDDVCHAFVYAVIGARAAGEPHPPFSAVYARWLDATVRVSTARHLYEHHGQNWTIQIITCTYGRIGLIVRRPAAVHYVHDAALACPAEGFMAALLAEIAQTLAPAGG
ncbi:MAG: hypothetical protein SNJ59_04740 [Aggregatilineales bacterium]